MQIYSGLIIGGKLLSSKKINFRKAIRLAINKEKIIKTVFSYNGNTLSGPYSTNTPFYNNNVNEERKSHKKNIEKAKKLLEEIGYNYDKKVEFFMMIEDIQ